MKTTRTGAAIFELRATRLRSMRALRDLRGGPPRLRRLASDDAAASGDDLARSETSLRADSDDDPQLTDGKIENLRIAVRALDGLVVPEGATFGLWRALGKPSAARGFVRGRELREGCLVPTIGGGLCQLSNALYACALDAGFEILERHAHSQRVPGSQATIGRDATIFWNYLDLRFRAQQAFVIEARLGRTELTIALRAVRSLRASSTSRPRPVAAHARSRASASGVIDLSDLFTPSIGTCTTCDTSACARHEPHAEGTERASAGARTAYLLDGVSPEFDAYVREHVRPGDLVRIPIDGRRFRIARYAWTTSALACVDEYRLTALRRTLRSRLDGFRPFGGARTGGARQRVALEEAERLARVYARRLPSDVRHVVIAQPLLPFAWLAGTLGGRSFDLLTTLAPMAEIHSVLDAGAAAHPSSRTFADFRAPRRVVDAEREAFAAARLIVTPNAAIAAAAGSRAIRLPWHVPASASGSRPRDPARSAVVFAGPTLARAGAYEMRAAARALGVPLVVTNETDLEDDNFWRGIEIARLPFGDALARAAVIVSPAYVSSQPRRELRARALGIPVIVTDACGLGEGAGISTIPIGDPNALRDEIARALVDLPSARI